MLLEAFIDAIFSNIFSQFMVISDVGTIAGYTSFGIGFASRPFAIFYDMLAPIFYDMLEKAGADFTSKSAWHPLCSRLRK